MKLIQLGMAAFVCGLWACTDGEGTPFLRVPEPDAGSGWIGQAGGAAGQTPAGRGAAAGRGGAAGAGGSGGGDRRLPKDCQQWSGANESDEKRLVELFNELRANPGPVCGRVWVSPALERDEELQCIARLRFAQSPQRSMPGAPSFSTGATSGPPDYYDPELRERANKVGVSANLVELRVIGAAAPEDVIDVIFGTPYRDLKPTLCDVILTSPAIGVARVGSTWAIDFPWPPTRNSPAHSGPGDH